MTMKMDGFHQVIAVEKFMSMQGDGQVILKNQNLHMTVLSWKRARITKQGDFLGREKDILGHNETNYGTNKLTFGTREVDIES